MGEWKEYKLGDLGTIITGKTPSSKNPEDWGNEMLFVTPTDYCNYRKYSDDSIRKLSNIGIKRLKNKILPPSSILVTCIGSDMGKVVMTKSYCITNQQINSIIPNNLVNPDFLYYTLISSYDTLRVLGGDGTAVPIVNKNDFSNISINIPSLSEQKRIVSILGSLDDKIDLLHHENETLEAMAETLFRKWFIENTESSVKQDYLGDYILDTIGGEWGKEVSQDDFVKPVKCIRGTDIAALNTGIPSKTPLRFIKKSKYEKIKPLDGDIIIEISGGTENQSTGRSLYINKEVCGLFDYPIIFSNFCRLLRVEKKYSYFVYCYLQYLYRQDEFFNIENGSSGIKNLDYKTLLYNNQYQMPTNKNFAANFSEIITPYFTKIDKNKLQICNLMKMRDTLLPRLIFNKIKI